MSNEEDAKLAQTYSQKLLQNLREIISVSDLDYRRLPRWLESANVRTANVYNTLLLMAESEQGEDKFTHIGEVDSDIEFFLDIPDYPDYGVEMRVNRQFRQKGKFDGGRSIQSLTVEMNEGSHLLGFDYSYHRPLILLDAQILITDDDDIISTRYIPFGLFVHTDEFLEPEGHFESIIPTLLRALRNLHNSPKGDEYKERREREKAILGRKEDSVIILGNYQEKRKSELLEVRDLLRTKGYQASLIENLPSHAGMDLRDKVRAWTSTARFCLMVDSEPSGHNNEYEILREQETIFAVLRPKSSGSSYMMGPDIDRNRRRTTFEYESSPIEAVEEVIDWAENLISDEEEEFSKYYPWRAN